MVLKTFEWKILVLLCGETYLIKGKNKCLTDCVRNLNAGVHFAIYKSISFKLGRILNAVPSLKATKERESKHSVDFGISWSVTKP